MGVHTSKHAGVRPAHVCFSASCMCSTRMEVELLGPRPPGLTRSQPVFALHGPNAATELGAAALLQVTSAFCSCPAPVQTCGLATVQAHCSRAVQLILVICCCRVRRQARCPCCRRCWRQGRGQGSVRQMQLTVEAPHT